MAPGKHLKDLQNLCQDAGQKQKFEKYIDQDAGWTVTRGRDVGW